MSRFESHVTGKQHIVSLTSFGVIAKAVQGFEKIRSCLEELKRRRDERVKTGTGVEPQRKSIDRFGSG